MSQSGVGAAAVVGLVGLAVVPAFVLPGAAPGGHAALRGLAAKAPAQAQASGAAASIACAGVLGAAAVAGAAARRPTARARKAVACRAFDPSTQVGVTAPFGFFDPAGFAKGCDEAEFNRLRSSEIRHGRAAMMSSLGLAVQSVYKLPGYESVPAGLGAQWTEPGSNTLVVVFFLIGCLEIGLSPWSEDPTKPGDYGDPMNLGNYTVEMRNKELNNGRMAMFAVLGLVSAEVYTGQAGMAQFALARPELAAGQPSLCGSSLAAGLSVSRGAGCRAERCGRQVFDGASQPGASAPLGYFDPLKLSGTQERFDKFRTSEIKHGRVAMLAVLGAIAQHWGHAPGAENIPAGMKGFSDPIGQKGVIALTLACGFLELGPWADRFAKEPGNFGDPARFASEYLSYDKEMRTKELNNGRLAMLATIGVIAAEMATGNAVSDIPGQLGF